MTNSLIDDLNMFKTERWLKVRSKAIDIAPVCVIGLRIVVSIIGFEKPFWASLFSITSFLGVVAYFILKSRWIIMTYENHNAWLGVKIDGSTYINCARFTGEGVLDLYKARESLKRGEKPEIDVIAEPKEFPNRFNHIQPEYCFPIFEYLDAAGNHHYGVDATSMTKQYFDCFAKRPVLVYTYENRDECATCEIPSIRFNAPLKQYDSLQDLIDSGDKIPCPVQTTIYL